MLQNSSSNEPSVSLLNASPFPLPSFDMMSLSFFGVLSTPRYGLFILLKKKRLKLLFQIDRALIQCHSRDIRWGKIIL